MAHFSISYSWLDFSWIWEEQILLMAAAAGMCDQFYSTRFDL